MSTISADVGSTAPSTSVPSNSYSAMFSGPNSASVPPAVSRNASSPGIRALMLPCLLMDITPQLVTNLPASTIFCLYSAITAEFTSHLLNPVFEYPANPYPLDGGRAAPPTHHPANPSTSAPFPPSTTKSVAP